MFTGTSLVLVLGTLSVACALDSYATNGQYLFAVVGGDSCAEDLSFGPQQLTEAGTDDSVHQYYLSTSTAGRRVPHDYWMQVVTSDGSTEVFRIYYYWNPYSTDPAMTLTERIAYGVSTGASVNYHVHETETEEESFFYDVIWAFSTKAAITTATFDVADTTCCLSANSGAWGAGEYVSGSNYTSSTERYSTDETSYPFDFWGVANFQDSDSAATGCSRIYVDGEALDTYAGSKSYLYYSTRPFEQLEDAEVPLFTLTVTQLVTGFNYSTYERMAGDFQYIFMAAVNEAIPLLDSQDVQIPLITEYTPVARRILSSADESTTLQADYVIHHYTDTISASDAAAQLETAVSSLTFQQSLQRLAGEYAISEAYNATSDTVLEITGAGSSEEDVKKKSGLSSGEIAAIVICGIVLLTFIFVGVCWISSCCCQSPPERRYQPTSNARAQSDFASDADIAEAAEIPVPAVHAHAQPHPVLPGYAAPPLQTGYTATDKQQEMQTFSANGGTAEARYASIVDDAVSTRSEGSAFTYGEGAMVEGAYVMAAAV